MPRHGKKYLNAKAKVDRTKRYTLDEALKTLLELKTAKFDETVDIAVNLGVNPKHADQMVRGAVVLPHGTGKTVKIAVFAKGEKEKEALEAGADFVGAEDLVEKIAGGWLGFDRAIATPDMMRVLGKVGKILGTKGLMPNPKVGTVTFEIKQAVTDFKKGKIDFKVEKEGILHAPIGKTSFGAEKLKTNFLSFVETVVKMKPASAKGTYMKGVAICTTMGPGFKLDAAEIRGYFK